jgi:hypothetical protein
MTSQLAVTSELSHRQGYPPILPTAQFRIRCYSKLGGGGQEHARLSGEGGLVVVASAPNRFRVRFDR